MDDQKQQYFKAALSDFALDVAAGGAIRSLATKGYTVEEIRKRLDFPVSKEQIGLIIWNHFLETGIILLQEPDTSKENFAVTYEMVHDAFGKASFRQVRKKTEYSGEYLPCDFGKQIYQNKNNFLKKCEMLSIQDRDYILGLPWPLATVWHKKDERIMRIMKLLQE